MKILFMGDSITHWNLWVKYFNEIIKPEHHVNIAVSGSRWCDFTDTVHDGKPVFRIEDNGGHNNTICNQVEMILRGKDKQNLNYSHNPQYDDFDIIFVFVGSNDNPVEAPIATKKIEEQFVSSDLKPLPLEKVDLTSWAGAMRYTYENLRRLYPNAKIFYCSPVQGADEVRPYTDIKIKGEIIKSVCDRISDVIFVDTFNCGICSIYETWQAEGRDLCDGLHPNDNGAKKIADFIARAVKMQLL